MPLIIFTGMHGVEASVDIKPYEVYEWFLKKENQGIDLVEYMLNIHLKHKPLEPAKILPDEPERHCDLYRIYGTLKILRRE